MKTLVVYSSRTGNTKKLAEAIAETLGSSSCVDIDSAPAPDDYELIVVGFWTNLGKPDDRAQKYLRSITGKKVAVFGTCGAFADSDHARQVLAWAKAMAGDNEVVASFICQGRIDPSIYEQISADHPGEEHAERWARVKESQTHPDAHDLEHARKTFAGLA